MSKGYALAYCDIARQYYRLTLMNDNRTVSDFTLCDSAANQAGNRPKVRLTTDPSLRACPICGSRSVAQCDCMHRAMPCEPLVGFRFSCIYCSHLRLLGFYPHKAN